MTVSLPYLSSNKNIGTLFEKIASAKIPPKFTHDFLVTTIGLKGTNDRPLITLLKNLEFLDQSGTPTASYSSLKGANRGVAIANGIRLAYAPLFESNEKANELAGDKLKGLVAQIAGSDDVMTGRIASTFSSLTKIADFKSVVSEPTDGETKNSIDETDEEKTKANTRTPGLRTEFHYNIQVHLPANRVRGDVPQHLQCHSQNISMKTDATASLFLMLGQAADKSIQASESIVPKESLLLSTSYDLAEIVPDKVRRASDASEAYKLFFVFESYLREIVVDTLTKEDDTKTWWDFVPSDVKDEVAKLEATEGAKAWMALGSRDKSALMTLPQLLKVIDHAWKEGFDETVRDKGLIHEARLLGHLRNTICHMSTIPAEETARIKQTMRDWFRVVAP